MKRMVFVGALVGLLAASSAFAQPANASLGSVTIGKKVMADGKPLAPGTYQVRLTNDAPKPGVGQAADAEKYVEFVKGGKVVAREVATVISAEDIGKIAKSKKPARNAVSTELLKGGDYYRVWINHGGTNYLINLPTGAS
jgi:hemin uptake protein HemP